MRGFAVGNFSPPPTSKLVWPLLSAVLPSYLEAVCSIRNLRTRHALVAGDTLNMTTQKYSNKNLKMLIFDVLTEMTKTMLLFLVVTPRGLVGRYQRFEDTLLSSSSGLKSNIVIWKY
jgi:hypothetical protein